MRNREISRQIQRLQLLVKKTQEASNDSVEIQSHWAKYLCVISAGVIENAIKEIYIEYVQRMVSKPVANYVISNLGQLRNPKTQKFLETAAAFKTIWKEDLESFVLVNGRGDAIDSIMGNRHRNRSGGRDGFVMRSMIVTFYTFGVKTTVVMC